MNVQIDRIDFTILRGGAILVTKMTRLKNERRDIPHESKQYEESTFDLDAALSWCRENGYTVKAWPKVGDRRGVRAWKGDPWPIRTSYQLLEMREMLTNETMHYWNTPPEKRKTLPLPRWYDMTDLYHADLAYVG